MDLSVLKSFDPAGFIAESKQKRLKSSTKNYARSLDQQGYQQTPGSISGADSGQFHIYRKARRHELERIKEFEDEIKDAELDDQFRKQKEEKLNIQKMKTEKNKAKRLKKKAAKEKIEASSNTTDVSIANHLVLQKPENAPSKKVFDSESTIE